MPPKHLRKFLVLCSNDFFFLRFSYFNLISIDKFSQTKIPLSAHNKKLCNKGGIQPRCHLASSLKRRDLSPTHLYPNDLSRTKLRDIGFPMVTGDSGFPLSQKSSCPAKARRPEPNPSLFAKDSSQGFYY